MSIEEPREAGLRVAILGAFPFPLPQGSQIYMADHARALGRAGVRATVLTYGRGEGRPPDDLESIASPRWLAPTSMRSGPNAAKPFADAALLRTYLQTASRQTFDYALAHNAEAAAIALMARPRTRVPVIYVAHTILGEELSSYASEHWKTGVDRIGRGLDRWLARRADAVLTLCEDACQILAPHCQGPIATIPPGHHIAPKPPAEMIARVCAQWDLTPDQYILYSGNLDRYQGLDVLEEAARRQPAGSPPIVIATHDAKRAALSQQNRSSALKFIAIKPYEEMRALLHGARCLVLSRSRRGGFPIKLLNYMETGRPIVASEGIAIGLRDGVSARLLSHPLQATELAKALVELDRNAELRVKLGATAHEHLKDEHDWDRVTAQCLDFIRRIKPETGQRPPSRSGRASSRS